MHPSHFCKLLFIEQLDHLQVCHPEQAKRAEGSVPIAFDEETDSSTPLRSAQNDI